MQAIMKFIKDEDGVVAIEYAIMASVVVVGLLAVFAGPQSVFTAIETTIEGVLNFV